jgi:hypothetical protein
MASFTTIPLPDLPGWSTEDLLGFDASFFDDPQETAGKKRGRGSTEDVSLFLRPLFKSLITPNRALRRIEVT